MFLYDHLMYLGTAHINAQHQADPEAAEKDPHIHARKAGQQASAEVDDNDSLYAFNNIYIEVCGTFDTLRGLITLFIGFFLFKACSEILPDLWGRLFPIWVDVQANEASFFGGFVFAVLLAVGVTGVLVWLFWKWGWQWLRYDCLTLRRGLVRFNRKDRKVYVYLPRYAGGIREFKWDDFEAEAGAAEGMATVLGGVVDCSQGMGKAVVLWAGMIGKIMGTEEEALAFWEYIRRYMEYGPSAVPAPRRLLSKRVSPWHSLVNVFEPLAVIARQHLWLWPFIAILSPFLGIWAGGHWIAMLLSVEPKWPEHIRRECGEKECQ
jgi:hypothetical protein